MQLPLSPPRNYTSAYNFTLHPEWTYWKHEPISWSYAQPHAAANFDNSVNNFNNRTAASTYDVSFHFADGKNPLQQDEKVDHDLRQALAMWEEVTNVKFAQSSEDNAYVDLRFGVMAESWIKQHIIDSLDGELGATLISPNTYTDPLKDIYVDTKFGFLHPQEMSHSIIGVSGEVPYVGVFAHEIGHALGLDHPPRDLPLTLMSPTVDAYTPYLTQDDIKGVQAIYGEQSSHRADGVVMFGGYDSEKDGPYLIENEMKGTDKIDVISGGKGEEIIVGGLGGDLLVGGPAYDAPNPDGQEDVFRYYSPQDSQLPLMEEINADMRTWDTIVDFEKVDKIDLSQLDADTTSAKDDPFIIHGWVNPVSYIEDTPRGAISWFHFDKGTWVFANVDDGQSSYTENGLGVELVGGPDFVGADNFVL